MWLFDFSIFCQFLSQKSRDFFSCDAPTCSWELQLHFDVLLEKLIPFFCSENWQNIKNWKATNVASQPHLPISESSKEILVCCLDQLSLKLSFRAKNFDSWVIQALLGSIPTISYSIASMMKKMTVIIVSMIWIGHSISLTQFIGLALTATGLFAYDRWGGKRVASS